MADKEFSLINLDGLGECAKALLDKITSAIGWVATRETPKRIAIQTYIDDIKHGNFDPLTKAVLISTAQKTIAEYANQKAIIQHAISSMKETADPKQVENDWISQFMDKARLVSDSDFQLIWGRILAEECNTPGSVPRSLLHILGQMERNDAERFTKLCSFSVAVIENDKFTYSPIVTDSIFKDYISTHGLDFDSLVDLRALGLIEMNMGLFDCSYSSSFSNLPIEVHYFDKRYVLPDEAKVLPVGNVIFTKTGQVLCQAIVAEEQEDFFDKYCVPFWKSKFK